MSRGSSRWSCWPHVVPLPFGLLADPLGYLLKLFLVLPKFQEDPHKEFLQVNVLVLSPRGVVHRACRENPASAWGVHLPCSWSFLNSKSGKYQMSHVKSRSLLQSCSEYFSSPRSPSGPAQAHQKISPQPTSNPPTSPLWRPSLLHSPGTTLF